MEFSSSSEHIKNVEQLPARQGVEDHASKISHEIKQIVEVQMRADDQKRLEWAVENTELDFDDVIWTDECTVQLESHRRFCCRKIGEAPRNKPKAKHPVKVHVWAGISLKGATSVCIFEGIMNAPMYVDILEKTLLPFIVQVMPTSHRLMQDNDPKHTSVMAKDFFDKENVNWWKTPPESPDCNPIENLWHELKEFIRRETKPKIKAELVEGIQRFWATVNIQKCERYVYHLRKVIPKVIELDGDATGY